MPELEKAVFRVHIRGPIQDVWREITKTDEPQGGLFNMKLHTNGLRPGGQIRMRSRSGKYTGVVGEVLEFNPPYRYVITFKFTAYDDPPCKVIFDLKEVDGGVELTLTHEDLVSGTKTAKQMNQGGTMIVNTIKAIVETGRPALGTRMLYVLFKVLEPISPKQCRSELWPLPNEASHVH
jgi:uncharacterized protein YndB with AHSA1/START domain